MIWCACQIVLVLFAMIDPLIDIDACEDFCINGSISIYISVFRLVSFHFLKVWSQIIGLILGCINYITFSSSDYVIEMNILVCLFSCLRWMVNLFFQFHEIICSLWSFSTVYTANHSIRSCQQSNHKADLWKCHEFCIVTPPEPRPVNWPVA